MDEMIGKKFGKLTILERVKQRTKNCGKEYLCLCDCGEQRLAKIYYLKNGTAKECKECLSKRLKTLTRSNSPTWKGHGEISLRFWNLINKYDKRKPNRNKRAIKKFITIEYAWDLFLKQNRKCKLSGIELYFPKNSKSRGTASLDRIDSNGDYTEGNVQWVHKDINIMKMNKTDEEFILMCRAVAKERASQKIVNSTSEFSFL